MGSPPIQLLPFLVIAAALILPVWMIVRKAGYPGATSLLAFVPVLNIVMLFAFAFAEWPVLRELASRRAGSGSATRT